MATTATTHVNQAPACTPTLFLAFELGVNKWKPLNLSLFVEDQSGQNSRAHPARVAAVRRCATCRVQMRPDCESASTRGLSTKRDSPVQGLVGERWSMASQAQRLLEWRGRCWLNIVGSERRLLRSQVI
jgi:hypothetical protein